MIWPKEASIYLLQFAHMTAESLMSKRTKTIRVNKEGYCAILVNVESNGSPLRSNKGLPVVKSRDNNFIEYNDKQATVQFQQSPALTMTGRRFRLSILVLRVQARRFCSVASPPIAFTSDKFDYRTKRRYSYAK